VSVMFELPVSKQSCYDVISVIKGNPVKFVRYFEDRTSVPCTKVPSAEISVANGFMSMARFCYPGKNVISQIEEDLLDVLFGNSKDSFLPVYDDQYISTGGQLYELICGHDRFVADFRGALYEKFRREGKKSGQVCHPYDMAAALIGIEMGLILTNLDGTPFDAPLEMTYEVDWIGYANESIKRQIENPFHEILKKNLLL
jgi:hypothetical protein